MVKAETRISVVTGTGPRSKSSDKIMNNSTLRSVLLALLFCLYAAPSAVSSEVTVITDPKFSAPIANVTAAVGREATLTCVVHDLGAYKVAWLRVDTQTILTIQNHVITKNKRIGIIYTEKKTWQLRIRDIRESDKGWYMCQINTDPMKSQMGYLDVVVPPDILDYPTSTDMVVREGSNVTLRCAATGSPAPAIVWRREGGENISLQDGELVPSIEGPTFSIPKVNRLHMGAYLCIASNGVPPSVSKRVMLIVHFPPMIWVPNQLVGAVEGQRMTLECHSEAYPKSINYWTREKGDIVPQGGKYEPVLIDNAYKVVMKLSIKVVSQADFGAYKCIAKNSLGETDGTIKLYKLPKSAINSLDSHEGRRKSKYDKSRKGHAFYETNDVLEDDTESSSKRKDLIVGGRNDESYEISSSVAFCFPLYRLHTLLFVSFSLLLTALQPTV
ncbi:neurotrimin-like isoform X1 [Topomyia yanbarensis]|uniref:neurotrimin-like isoform X1 n=1 Tax=Topomyia yanbarensis TaxID=2498891 RepID=UPI00273A9013|nr:neurotrimin-like isoform X1 [Topomyia yanbarensis]XP_058820338.1 neurotrimin-like isoform X1 [Topomyia yanbarensis]XP_058820339.1 neurotrimin-like isoform X1 [Topomyia yanbarensis]XP_058820340.1 neurotrimin-like isoform X1 [Topomyia yanbarensis]XP_058820341.1 neurotrimin-like isoform X1 [Topomyia yanbarensis]XP_058820342.1 neurotrimin-like isoform X1 [Topomyia yanbarensis]